MLLKQKQLDIQTHINALLDKKISELSDHAPILKSAMSYSLLNGGKRMRPFLVYTVGSMLGVKKSDLDYPALAVEFVHCYSLIHDDLPAMDDDDMRRGKPTCHIKFDEATAILAGDALQTLAFDVLAHADLSTTAAASQLKLLQLLSQASGYSGMCGGQAMDLAATNHNISQQRLQQLHELKTGALIRVSVMMAAALSDNIQDSDWQTLEKYSQALGLAFQVQDDILDVVGESSVLGKPQGSDQAHNKSTYPALLGLQGAKDYLADLHRQALHALDALPYNTELLRLFTDYNVQRNH